MRKCATVNQANRLASGRQTTNVRFPVRSLPRSRSPQPTLLKQSGKRRRNMQCRIPGAGFEKECFRERRSIWRETVGRRTTRVTGFQINWSICGRAEAPLRREACIRSPGLEACKKFSCGDGLFMTERPGFLRGRGAGDNPPNRFEKIHLERDEDWNPAEDPSPKTQFLRDLSQSIISYNDSPDIPFNASLNGFSGCEHGCSYCFSQTTNEISPSLRTHLHRRNEQ